jgi:YD repeat-containing protein
MALPNGHVQSYKYDPFGRRIQKITHAKTRAYAYDGDNIIEELKETGSAAIRYTQGLGIDEPRRVSFSGFTLRLSDDPGFLPERMALRPANGCERTPEPHGSSLRHREQHPCSRQCQRRRILRSVHRQPDPEDLARGRVGTILLSQR